MLSFRCCYNLIVGIIWLLLSFDCCYHLIVVIIGFFYHWFFVIIALLLQFYFYYHWIVLSLDCFIIGLFYHWIVLSLDFCYRWVIVIRNNLDQSDHINRCLLNHLLNLGQSLVFLFGKSLKLQVFPWSSFFCNSHCSIQRPSFKCYLVDKRVKVFVILFSCHSVPSKLPCYIWQISKSQNVLHFKKPWI